MALLQHFSSVGSGCASELSLQPETPPQPQTPPQPETPPQPGTPQPEMPPQPEAHSMFDSLSAVWSIQNQITFSDLETDQKALSDPSVIPVFPLP